MTTGSAHRTGGMKDPLALPDYVDPTDIKFGIIAVFLAVHLCAAAAALPWLFSWSGLIAALAGMYVFGALGINVCYHRLLTHRSFSTPSWFERFLCCLGFCNLEGSSIRWVATHRMHHQHSDHQPDPHSPVVNFLWAHMGWMVMGYDRAKDESLLNRYARDLSRDRFHAVMHYRHGWFAVWLFHAAAFFAGGWLFGHLTTGRWEGGLRLAMSWLVWGVMVRTLLIWHMTWAINSVTHIWGYRRYKTGDDSRNNWLLGYLAFGEGWHNNHHADQRSARAGHRWWELDLAYQTIRLFRLLGLADNVIVPARHNGSTHDIEKRKSGRREGTAVPRGS